MKAPLFVAAIAIVAPLQPISAQSIASPDVETSETCELHVWPAEEMSTTVVGWLEAIAPSSSTDPITMRRRAALDSALDAESQVNALRSMSLETVLPLKPETKIIFHETPVERKMVNKVKSRRTSSESACYSELVAAENWFMEGPLIGSSLKTLFMIRDFGDDDQIDFEYKTWGGNKLELFPPKKDEDPEAAVKDLHNIYQQNLVEYAENARKKMERKGKSTLN